MNDWHIFKGQDEEGNAVTPHDNWELPPPPNWRPFGQEIKQGESRRQMRADSFQARPEEIDMVNAALYLRRPLLITGNPGTGKSSLAYAVAKELKLGEVLYWPITTRTTLEDGLYNYDAIARLQRLQEIKQQSEKGELTDDEQKKELETRSIEKYITLGPLGTALLPSKKPRVLLIDEIDKSDIDLPNNLLTIFEEGRFLIPELDRIKNTVETVNVRTAYTGSVTEPVNNGEVICTTFPLVFLTSNGERDFPPPFLRRCLRLTMKDPGKKHLRKIITAHLHKEIDNSQKQPEPLTNEDINNLVDRFIDDRQNKTLANDQLLNALFLLTRKRSLIEEKAPNIIDKILQDLGQVEEDE